MDKAIAGLLKDVEGLHRVVHQPYCHCHGPHEAGRARKCPATLSRKCSGHIDPSCFAFRKELHAAARALAVGALELAAKECDDEDDTNKLFDADGYAAYCAKRIRALQPERAEGEDDEQNTR